NVAKFERPGEQALVAEELMQPLAREREKGREDDLEGVDYAQSDVQDGCRALPVLLDHGPWWLVVDELVADARKPQRLRARSPETRLFDQLAHRFEASLHRRQGVAIVLGQLLRGGNLTEVP